MIKIFSFDKIIYLINNPQQYIDRKGNLLVLVASEKEFIDAYKKYSSDLSVQQIYFCGDDEKIVFNYFKSMFKIIEAAGGLVKNNNNEYLFIFRNGKWDLPKGKIEKGESIEIAAIREVEEECGVSDLKIIKQIITTFHTYYIQDKAILKPTYWFEMMCFDNSKLIPQIEEGITDTRWIDTKNFDSVRKNTYDSILDVINTIKK